ncbi:MAG: NHL repeat-containing protein, partial [Deltaproteobacteria bacterium]
MKRAILTSFCLFALCLSSVALAQVTLNPIPARVLGHPRLALTTGNPNLVEGKEFFGPQGIAIDKSANPPILYVADTSNNRVLAWRNAKQFANGAPADVVIGQKDFYSTFSLGPGTALVGGLRLPTGLAVDAAGNLFVADSGNNRILRFPKPFSQSDPVKSPDLALGQPSLATNTRNNGGRSAKTLSLNTVVGNRFVAAGLLFDGQGNLFACDPGNSRVLRYPASAVAPGATASGPDADMVLGQTAFTVDPQSPSGLTDLKFLAAPEGLALDDGGRLYVVDAYLRVLVFMPPLSTGREAQRLIGGIVDSQGQPLEPPTERSLDTPEGVFVVGNVPFVIDSANHRILRFDPFDQWPADTKVTPSAKAVIGQDSMFAYKPNRGSPLAQANSLAGPVAAVFFEGELYVADSLNHRVLVGPDPLTVTNWTATRVLGQAFLDADGVNRVEGREFYFGVPGFIGGTGVAVDRTSDPPHLYVADTLNNRILGFRDLRKVRPGDKADLVIGQPALDRTIPNYPSGSADQPQANNLLRPTGVVVDAAGNLYVADTGNGRVLRYPSPFLAGTNMPAANLVIGKPNFTTPAVGVPDPNPANTGGPYGLALTVGGHLLVSDVAFHRVLLFRKQAGGDFSNGQPASAVFGQTDFNSRIAGGLDAQMNSPRHIATDTNDRLYVCDTSNGRILFFDSATSKPATNNTADFVLSGFSSPQGIFVGTPLGEIWVADTGNRRLVRYPRFEVLIFNPQPEVTVPSGSTDEL